MEGPMKESRRECLDLLHALNETVDEACSFFLKVDQDLFDGHQNAREVLSHLVFWHREYVLIIKTLKDGQQPRLKEGTYAELNSAATREFLNIPMIELAHELRSYQDQLADDLRLLPNWNIDFPVKFGGRSESVVGRLPSIESHIRSHFRRLKRAERLGKDWVNTYYSKE
jgi:hypothetical protein